MLDDLRRPLDGRVPLHVLTGFLGSGKTTLLGALLERATEPIAVLVNEVGELGLDHHLLERVDEDVLLLPGGCVCCAVRGELYTALDRVLSRGATRLVLETTGLADPAPLLHSVGADPRLVRRVWLAGVVVVVDGLRAEELVATHAEVRRQLDFADRVVVTKGDLAPQRTADVRAWLERTVPGREIRLVEQGAVDVDWLLAPTGFGREDAAGGALGWLRERVAVAQPQDDLGSGARSRAATEAPEPHTTHAAFTSHAVRHDRPVDVGAVELWLRLVTQLDGASLLRVKALVRCRTSGAVYALQSAGRSVSPPRRLARGPAALAGAEVVVIERGLGPRAVERLLESLSGALRARARASQEPRER